MRPIRALFAFAPLALAACGESAPTATLPTWSEHIAPIVHAHCAPCHRPGESAPFSLLTYADARRKRRQIARVTRDGIMPPWLPADRHFVGDRRLSEAQVDTIQRWVAADTPRGAADAEPEPPTFPTGWQLREPDLIVTAPTPVQVPADGPDLFRNLVLPVPVDRLRYVAAVEIRPENPAAHHGVLALDRTGRARVEDAKDAAPGFPGMQLGGAQPPDGHFIGWTPGKLPRTQPDGMAWRLWPGSDLVLQLHLTPTGKPEAVQPRIGLYFTDVEPTVRPYALVLYSEAIDIPAGESAWRLRDAFTLPVPTTLFGLYPHAHYLCRTMHATATLPDGTVRTLLRIDGWDFDWQDEYVFAEPVELPAATVLAIDYVYDNSSANPTNPHDPPQRVTFGQDSEDEMGTLSLTLVPRSAEERLILHGARIAHDLEKKPWDWALWRDFAIALREVGRVPDAIRALHEALELRADYPAALTDLGICHELTRDLPAAESAYRRALAADPNWPEAHHSLGLLLARGGDPAAALPHFRRALDGLPNMPEIHNNLATAHLQLDQLDAAAKSYRAALTLHPDYFDARLNLGRTLSLQGQTEAARTELQRALTLRPGDQAARELLAELPR